MTGKFNKTVSTLPSSATTNYEGGLAFTMDPYSELYNVVATCLVREAKFYGTVEEHEKKILDLVNQISKENPKFILQLAAYARTKLNLRSISTVLLAEASLIPECKLFIKEYTPKIIKRVDELTEVIAYLVSKIGNIGNVDKKGSLPAALKKGLAETMHNFDEYRYSKYDRKGSVKLRDVIRLVHPKPRDEAESTLFKKIAKSELGSANTWEVLISTKGSNKETWTEALKLMPIMALIRNLRNLLDNDVEVEEAYQKLTNPEIIRKSKQFPFRFLSAYNELESNTSTKTVKLLQGLEQAIDISVENIPRLTGTTAIFTDNSGSMDSYISGKSKMKLKQIANVFGAICNKISDNAIVCTFADRLARLNLNPRNGLLNNTKIIDNTNIGGSTYAHLCMQYLIQNNLKVDRIILISDMQCYNEDDRTYGYSNGDDSVYKYWNEYKNKINHNTYFYSLDLNGYSTLQVPQNDPRTCLISGWTEQILNYIPIFETEKGTALDEIKKY